MKFIEVESSDDAQENFIKDFVTAWAKVLHLDRYDHLLAMNTIHLKIKATPKSSNFFLGSIE